MGYSVEMKEAVLKKALVGDRPHHKIVKEADIDRSTLGHWLRAHRRKGNQNLILLPREAPISPKKRMIWLVDCFVHVVFQQ